MTFTVFDSSDDPMLTAWVRFRHQFTTRLPGAAAQRHRATPQRPSGTHSTGVTPAVNPPRRSGLWRLLATNNRELGRSFHLYTSLESARAHVRRLQDDAANLEVVVVAGPANASRGWIIAHEGAPVMTSSRWYDSSSTGGAAAAGALAALAEAIVAVDADRTAPSGRFSRRASLGAPADA